MKIDLQRRFYAVQVKWTHFVGGEGRREARESKEGAFTGRLTEELEGKEE